jgi:hypothetical protein
MTTHLPSALTALPLPSVQRLHELMLSLGCCTRDGVCLTHSQPLLVHDGGRVACSSAWDAAAEWRPTSAPPLTVRSLR